MDDGLWHLLVGRLEAAPLDDDLAHLYLAVVSARQRKVARDRLGPSCTGRSQRAQAEAVTGAGGVSTAKVVGRDVEGGRAPAWASRTAGHYWLTQSGGVRTGPVASRGRRCGVPGGAAGFVVLWRSA